MRLRKKINGSSDKRILVESPSTFMQSFYTTRLSSKGQITIPKAIRALHGWNNGQEFIVEEIEQGLLLRPYSPAKLPKTALSQVVGCLKNRYKGKAKTIEDMDTAVAQSSKNI